MTARPAPIRRPAVAGSWYPGNPEALAAEVDSYLARAGRPLPRGSVRGLVSPHAGLMYSGPVAAWAYLSVESDPVDVVVLVGPSHRLAFDGVALFPRGAWDTPFGLAQVAEEVASAIAAGTDVVHESESAHAREHSLEMQLPLLKRVLPSAPIVPLLMGLQTPETVNALAGALAAALTGRSALLVASSDLSHYLDSRSAALMDRKVTELVGAFDADGLLEVLRREPDHACGGGPVAAVMKASRALGATRARVLRYADSGDVSGDKSAVVGYMAAAFGTFPPDPSQTSGAA